MSSQGPNSGSTFANDATIGTVDWTDPGNAQYSDNAYATAGASGDPYSSHYLKVTVFGFSIPSGSTINGIVVEVEKKANDSHYHDASLKIVKGGTISGDEKKNVASWQVVDTYLTYGGESDLWGLSWTPAEINASGFGVVLSTNYDQDGFATASVDHIRVTVYYTLVTAYTLTADAGSYTKTGQAAALKAARKIVASPSSYSLTGQAVALRPIRKMAAGAGSLTLSGQLAQLLAARRIVAAPGSYVLTGQPVTLRKGYGLVASPGSYLVTGYPASLIYPKSVRIVGIDAISGKLVYLTGKLWET